MNSSVKQIEVALKESEDKFRSLTQSATDSIILANQNGQIIFWNKAAEKMFGYKESDILNQSLEVIMPMRFRQAHSDGMKRHINSGYPKLIGKTIEVVAQKKDGTEFPIELSLSKWNAKGTLFFCGIIRDISERKQTEEEIKKSLKEKDVLLKEVHHRVKNNLQIVNSLLNIYSRDLPEEATQVFRDCQSKIQSMARVHSNLYRSNDMSSINFEQYIKEVCRDIQQSVHRPEVKIVTELSDAIIGIDQAISCGLILSELLSNAFKHAFPNKQKGIITVKLHQQKKEIKLEILDNGTGFSKEKQLESENSYGIEMVSDLVGQIDGEIKISSGSNGTHYAIFFPNQGE